MASMDNWVKELRALINEQVAKLQTVQLYVVTGLNLGDNQQYNYTVNIKHPSRINAYDKVPIVGLGLGNVKGVMKLPAVGDWVLVAFIGGETLRPFVIGTLFDSFTQSPDNIPVITDDQLLLVSKEAGSFISINKDNSIVIRSVDANGSPDNGARFRLNPDGSFKIFNKGNFGIEVDASGNMTLRGVAINSTQTAGTWP